MHRTTMPLRDRLPPAVRAVATALARWVGPGLRPPSAVRRPSSSGRRTAATQAFYDRYWPANVPDVRATRAHIHRLVPAGTVARALDAGCGTGVCTVALAERAAHVTGLDVSAGSLATARRLRDAATAAAQRPGETGTAGCRFLTPCGSAKRTHRRAAGRVEGQHDPSLGGLLRPRRRAMQRRSRICGYRKRGPAPSPAASAFPWRGGGGGAAGRGQISFCQGSLLALPFAAAAFDLVLSWGVVHHTADPDRALDELVRVLRPGGTLVLAVYRKTWLTPVHEAIRRVCLALPRGARPAVIWSGAALVRLVELAGARDRVRPDNASSAAQVEDWYFVPEKHFFTIDEMQARLAARGLAAELLCAQTGRLRSSSNFILRGHKRR